MLCPNTQSVANGYAAGMVGVQDHLSQSVSKFGLGDMKKCRRKELEGANPIFYQDPPKFFVDGENGKKLYEKKGK